MCVAVVVDEGPHDFSRRPGSAWAKKALASFRISLARRSSLTSRSSAFIRSCSDVVVPTLAPVSTLSRLTHSFSVWGTQPILGAMDSMAAHSDGYSPRCSCTMRTARSRTSGKNLFDFFMAQSSQRFEPPQNPGRFRMRMESESRVVLRVVVHLVDKMPDNFKEIHDRPQKCCARQEGASGEKA
ncbi:hypothetical protein RCH06_000285 [Polaromonas sp. CG_9.5]|nr:hypothetical protein [Polaromonas sp. CG_9.5]